jgi:hypothetical protein
MCTATPVHKTRALVAGYVKDDDRYHYEAALLNKTTFSRQISTEVIMRF